MLRLVRLFQLFNPSREECEAQINSIKMRKRALKAELKSGRMDNIIYQRTLMPLNKQISKLEFNISFKKDELFNKYLSEGISYYTIEDYMSKKNNIQK